MDINFLLDNFPSFSESKENEQKILLNALESFPVKDAYDPMFDDKESDKKLLAYFKRSMN